MTEWHLQNVAAWKRVVKPRLPDRPSTFIEIGSHQGSSCVFLCGEILRPADRIICVDPWGDASAEAVFDAATSNLRQVTKHRGKSADYLTQISAATPDFRVECVYIDGDHDSSSVLADAVLSWRLLALGGMLVFDDYRWEQPPSVVGQQCPAIGVDAFIDAYLLQLEVLHRGTCVVVRKTRRSCHDVQG